MDRIRGGGFSSGPQERDHSTAVLQIYIDATGDEGRVAKLGLQVDAGKSASRGLGSVILKWVDLYPFIAKIVETPPPRTKLDSS